MTNVHRWDTAIISVLLFPFAMSQFRPTIDEREFNHAEYLCELTNPLGPYWDESTWSDGDSMPEPPTNEMLTTARQSTATPVTAATITIIGLPVDWARY
jgi:hypothetical protein